MLFVLVVMAFVAPWGLMTLVPASFLPFAAYLLTLWAALTWSLARLLAAITCGRLTKAGALAVIVLEELFPGVWIFMPVGYQPGSPLLSPWRFAVSVLSLGLVALLLRTGHLGATLLPLRGRWLRRALAACALAGLAYGHPTWHLVAATLAAGPDLVSAVILALAAGLGAATLWAAGGCLVAGRLGPQPLPRVERAPLSKPEPAHTPQ